MSATQLHLAAFDGDTDAVNQLLIEGALVDARTARGETPLLIAAMRGNGEIVRALVKWGADVNAMPTEGRSALRHAVSGGHAEMVGLLLARGADPALHNPPKPPSEEVRQKSEEQMRKISNGRRVAMEAMGVTPSADSVYDRIQARSKKTDIYDRLVESSPEKTLLNMAVRSGSLETLRLLLEAGLSPNATDKLTSLSVLSFAQSTSSGLEMPRLLLQYGADPDGSGNENMTPLQAAILKADRAFAEMLLDAGARTDVERSGMGLLALSALYGDAEMSRILLERGIGLNEEHMTLDRNLSPALKALRAEKRGVSWWQAVRDGNLTAVRAALDEGADVNATDRTEGTALLIATKIGNAAMMHLLLEAGADANLGTAQESPLHAASAAGNLKAVLLLIEYGGDVAMVSTTGFTPLHAAAVNHRDAVADKLIASGAVLGVPDAILLRRIDAAEAMLAKGAPIDFANDAGITPLHAAIEIEDLALTERLLDRGAPPNTVTRTGQTPLHRAVTTENLAMARLLLDHGADPAGNPDAVETPLKRATQYWNAPLARLLLERGAPLEQPLSKRVREALLEKNETEEEKEHKAWMPSVAEQWKRDHAPLNELLTMYGEYRRKEKQDVPQWEDRERLWATIDALLDFGAPVCTAEGASVDGLSNLIEFGAPFPIIQRVIEKGADVHPAESQRKYPLLSAVEAERTEIVKLLLEAGADPNAGISNESLLQVATEKNLAEIVALLQQFGASDEIRAARIEALDEEAKSYLRTKMRLPKSANPLEAIKQFDLSQMLARSTDRQQQKLQDYRKVLEAEVHSAQKEEEKG